jgi:hypothetical protein
LTAPQTTAPQTSALRLAGARRLAGAPAGTGAAAAAAPAAPEAAAEQGARKSLSQRLRDANIAERARSYNPTGIHRGSIVSCAVTKSGNGVQVRVKHADGESFGSLNFNLQKVQKLPSGEPELGEDGLPILVPSVGAWNAWEAFCGRYGLSADDTLEAVEGGRAADTGLIGVEEVWKWTQSGDFLNITLAADGSAAA